MLLFMIRPVLFGSLASKAGGRAGGAHGGWFRDMQVRLLASRSQQLQAEGERGRPAGSGGRGSGGAHADTDTSTARTHAPNWILRAAAAIGTFTVDADARTAPASPEKSDLAPLTLSIQVERITNT